MQTTPWMLLWCRYLNWYYIISFAYLTAVKFVVNKINFYCFPRDWKFPLINMGDIQHGGQVEFAAGRRWQRLVDAYREDFDSRGESKLSVHFDGLNICRRNQERPAHACSRGPMRGLLGCLASLCQWALSTGRSYSAVQLIYQQFVNLVQWCNY